MVKKDGERIYPGASGEGNNAAYDSTTHVLTVISAATNADYYLKVYDDGYDSWLTGYSAPIPQPAVYSLTIGTTDYSFTDVSSEKGQEDTWNAQFKAELTNIQVGDELVIKKDGERIYPGASGEGNNAAYDNDTHVLTVRTAAASAEFYLKVYDDGYDSWLTGYSAPVPTPAAYTMHVGEDSTALVDCSDDDKMGDNWIHQYKATGLTLAADAVINFKKDGTLITKIGASSGTNNVKNGEVDSGNLIVKTAGATIDVYLKEYEDGGYAVWASGYVPETVEMTFTVTYDTGDGFSVYMLGNFCNWDITSSDAIKFTWTTGNVWTATVDVEKGFEYHVKLVKAATENPTSVVAWEKDGTGNERVATFTEAGTLDLVWGNY